MTEITQEEYFALKLIEQMAKTEKIPRNVFNAILNDYRGRIDFSDFSCYDSNSRILQTS